MVARFKSLETTSNAADAAHELMNRARKGDASALPALRKAFENPIFVEIFGNMARHAERALVRAAAGENLGYKEAVECKLDLLRAELAGPNPTPIERLLVDRVVACWLQVHHADILLAQENGCSFRAAEFHQRRLNQCHKRYLSAIKTLALVRKLAVPVLQVNIAKKQINVAGAVIGKEGGGE